MKTKFVCLSLLVLFTFSNNIVAETPCGNCPISDNVPNENDDTAKGPHRDKKGTDVLEMEQMGHTLIFGSLFYGSEMELISESGESFIFYISDQNGAVIIPDNIVGVYSLNVCIGSSVFSTKVYL